MITRFAFATALIAAASSLPAQAATATFAISDKTFTITLPPGYCQPADKDLGTAQILAGADAENVTLLTLLPCDRTPGTPFGEYYLIKTPVRAIQLEIGRDELLAMLTTQLKAMGGEALTEDVKAKAGAGISGATGRQASVAGAYRYVGQTGACINMAGTMTFTTSSQAVDVDAASCLTGVGGKFIAVHRYAAHGRQGVETLLTSVRSLASSITPSD